MEFVGEFVAGAARAGPLRAAGLNHEVGNHAMEFEAVIEALLGQLLEVGDGLRGLVGVQLELDRAFACIDRGGFHLRVPWTSDCVGGHCSKIRLARAAGGMETASLFLN